MQVGALFGRYRLDRPLSVDATGEVWAAFDTITHRHVAVRALPPEATEDDDYRARFEREAEIAARIRNPHVVPIHDFGQIGSRLFLATTIVQGTSLQAMLRATGAMEVPRAVDVVEQLASALEAVHAAGLVEQEVTSANVLVQDDGLICLTDVGFPPHPGAASGVYGLTTVLYECLTGRLFQSSSGPTLPPQSSSVLSTLPAGMVDVIARGTAAEPARRYGSVGELAAAARTAATSQRPAHRASTAIVPVDWSRRILVAGLALAAIIAVFVVGSMALGAISPSSEGADPAPLPIAARPAAPTPSPPAAPTTPTGADELPPEPAPPRTEAPAAEAPPLREAAPPAPTPRSAPQSPPAPPPAPAPPPPAPAPQVLPCYPGYEHTPPPDGPCLPAGSPPAPAPAPPAPAPQVLPCYPGYEHTPPPDGPCLPAGSPPAPAPAPPAPAPAPAPEILPCYPGYEHTPPPDGPCWAPASLRGPTGDG
ncbi:serine/threonine-protein kinase [Rhodococcus aetherivorans]